LVCKRSSRKGLHGILQLRLFGPLRPPPLSTVVPVRLGRRSRR
jgi:hypothetical protein